MQVAGSTRAAGLGQVILPAPILGMREPPRRLHANGGADFGIRPPRSKAQPNEQKPRLALGSTRRITGQAALVQSRTTHRQRLEDAVIAPFFTIGAGSGQHYLDMRTLQTVGSWLFAIARQATGEAGAKRGEGITLE
jgi:hypothetical protein